MKKLVPLLLSILFSVLACFSAGCIVESRDPNASFGIGSGDSATSDSSGAGEHENQKPFTVKLNTTDGKSVESYADIYAIWTAVGGVGVYQAPFDASGMATCYGPDGEYQVTLSSAPTGYTYNPNIYYADNNGNHKTIDLYPLRDFTGGDGSNAFENAYKARTTGAYRFTFNRPADTFFFTFGASYSGEMSFQSLLDVTANEVSPIFYEHFISTGSQRQEIKGGGAENSYTKNFYFTTKFTDSQGGLYRMAVETINANAFPVTVDILIQKDGEYTESGSNLEIVAIPENLEAALEPPTGSTFVFLPDTNGKVLDEEMVVYVKEEDCYYLNKTYNQVDEAGKPLEPVADRQKPIFAVLTRDIPGVIDTYDMSGNRLDVGLSHGEIRQTCYSSGKDYTQFIRAHFALTNSDGSYQVTARLKNYLYDYSESKQLFYDNQGFLEPEYQTDSASRWLFACGYYE